MNKQLQQFKKQLENGQLAQSFLVVGPQGTGKFSTVSKMIGLLNDLSEEQIKLIKKGALPDTMLVEADSNLKKERKTGEKKEKKNNKKTKAVIRKKHLDKAIEKIYLQNFQFKKKVLIIRDANKLTNTASNSLLKLIEEPSKNLVIFLLVNNESDILATIKSRCQKITLSFLPDEEINKMLTEEFDLSEEQKKEIIQLAYGRIELAREYASKPELIKQAIKTRDDFRQALRGGKIQQLKLVEKVVSGENDLLWTLNEWVWYLKIFLEKNIADNQNKKIIDKVYNILKDLLQTRFIIKTSNANAKVQLENFFVQI